MAKIATVSLSSLVYCSCCVCCLAATSGVAIKTAAAAVVCAILIMHAMRLFMAAQLLVLPFVLFAATVAVCSILHAVSMQDCLHVVTTTMMTIMAETMFLFLSVDAGAAYDGNVDVDVVDECGGDQDEDDDDEYEDDDDDDGAADGAGDDGGGDGGG